jgi:hypothetical protein
MSTPTMTVQFRNPEDLIKFYMGEGIPAFGIKQKTDLNFKYEGDNQDEGVEKLQGIIDMMLNNKSSAIYRLCLYRTFGEEITDKTPCSLIVNFRFYEYAPDGTNSMGGFGNQDLHARIAALERKLQAKESEDEPHKLGVIGEILEMDALQPVIMGIATKVADWITGPPKMGEIQRISGIPGDLLNPPAETEVFPWLQDKVLTGSITRLYGSVADLGKLLQKLATIAEKNPKKFASYVKMLQTFG